jgi:hypothetical protein
MFARDQRVLMQLLGPKAGLTAVADHQRLIAALRGKRSAASIEQLTREHILIHLRGVRELMGGTSDRADTTATTFRGL